MSVGAWTTEKGTVMKTRAGCSACLPVSGSIAVMSNWFRPRRRSTSTLHVPSGATITRIGSWPGVVIETVAPGAEVPRNVYDVVDSSTSETAVAGSVTAIVGGLANRSSWMPRYAAKATTPTTSRSATTMPGEKVNPRAGAWMARGTTMTGSLGLSSPRSARHWSRISSGSRPRYSA